jgi:hypothetical protein
VNELLLISTVPNITGVLLSVNVLNETVTIPESILAIAPPLVALLLAKVLFANEKGGSMKVLGV